MSDAGQRRPLARVVFVPGMMGSALVDPGVPKDECRRILREGRFAQRVLTWLRVISALPGMPRWDLFFARVVCTLDPRQLWGANGMVLWALDAEGWVRRLSAGDGYRNSGGVRPHGLFRIDLPKLVIDPYARIPDLFRTTANLDAVVFPYDWRLDICGNAGGLAQMIRQRWWPEGLPAEGAENDRVLIIAHSMGGLIARYYIEHLGGHRQVRHLVTAGTPHRGAPLAHAILTKQRAPFGTLVEPGRTNQLLVGLGLPDTVKQVAGVGEHILPAEAQFRLFQHCSSGLQLLPSTPFVTGSGGTYEPLSQTYAGIRHPPTKRTAYELLGCVHHALVPVDQLPCWLARRRVRYTLIGSDGTPTITEMRRDAGGVARPVVTDKGDGVVPLSSAQLRPQVVGRFPLRTPTYFRVPHQGMFTDDKVLAVCREQIREHAGGHVTVAGMSSTRNLLELARTFPDARTKAVVSAVHVRLRRANARELLGVVVRERTVHGQVVRYLERKIPGTQQTPVGRLSYPGGGMRDFVYIDPFQYQVRGRVGGILLLPEPHDDVIELLTWNVGQAADFFRLETNRHHAEIQFTNWFEQQVQLRRWHATERILIANTTYSPCASCCDDLGKFVRTGAGTGLAEARIGWTQLYRSPHRPHLDTTRRTLALMSPPWIVEPTSPTPPAVRLGPPAPVRRRVPVAP